MTSTSSSAVDSPKKYDVFISFRGKDTRTNFTSHLHEALCRNQIETCTHDGLPIGHEVGLSIFKAIDDSALYLIVFSKNYASSRWCLNELAKIVEFSKDRGHHIIPVFYDVEPSHVSKQRGSYQKAFAKHEQTNHDQQVLKWRDALTDVANLSGWVSSVYRNDAELIENIVKGVLQMLKPIYQIVYDGLVGLQEPIAQLESLFCLGSQDVRFIGIWGMGGIGKTTIARALFEKLRFEFESFCFLLNIREQSEKEDGMTHLKTKLVTTLLEDGEPHMSMLDGGLAFVQRRLGQKKVLVVLDDVNDSEQLENLVGAHDWFGPGSRVIITTRDKQVLGNEVDDIFEVKALCFDDALQLFNFKVFKNNCPAKEFEHLSWEVVNYAGGHPFALVVLGSFLRGKGKEKWESLLEKLKKRPHTEIQQILKLSYDGLNCEEKNVFLDIACFFKGRRVKQIEMLLDACGHFTSIVLESLQDKALLTIYDDKVYMHDLIQKMGWEIVRQECLEDPGKRSRLWDPEDIYEVLKYNKGSEAIIGISLDVSKIKELELHPQVFAKMPRLKFLNIYDSTSEEHCLHLPQGTLEFLSNELRYLRWDKCPLKCLPLTFSAEKLVELDMQHSNIRKLWDGVQDLVNLKYINLSNSPHLMELPDFSKALKLEEAFLSGCSSLRKVHPSILSLHKLETQASHGAPTFKGDFEIPEPEFTVDLHDLAGSGKTALVDMASFSSSAPSSQSPKKYDVFISFRGEDTRSNFTSHLHAALCRNKIETYSDYRLEKGDEMWPSHIKAIEESTLFLIVFSENYASSIWCLDELTKILESSKDQGHPVFPVFYNIHPSHVQMQTGGYQTAFLKHEHFNHKQKIQKWRAALTEVANLFGWESSAYRNEAELIKNIVKHVLKILEPMYQIVYEDGLIGIQEQIAQLESLLCNGSQDVRFIGIWGMAGIGKTSIAKVLFKKLYNKFESHFFLANVRAKLKKHGITHLKTKLVSALLEDEEPCMGMLDGGSAFVWRRLAQKKVLLVLDDVNDSEQLESLVGAHDWFGPGSRVIITTRNRQALGVEYIYEVKALCFNDALQLFSFIALKNNCPYKEFEQLSREVVNYAGGHPFSLVVLGSFLRGKGKEKWKSLLEKLKKRPHTKIQKMLESSYDGLYDEEKNVFLDIACFFNGRGVKKVEILLYACGYFTSIVLESLQDKALLTIYDEKVYMHGLIREMGWEIVRQECLEDPGKRSRLWDPEDIYVVLKYNKGSEAIIGISLDASKIKELELHPEVFAKMPQLKFLNIYDSIFEENHLYLPQGTLEFLSNKLRYLRWDKCPLKCFPSTYSAERLVELDMQHSNIRKLWDGVQDLVNLKYINLSGSQHLMELPDFSKASNLEEAFLSGCSSLHKVHPSLLSLHKLEVLVLDGCKSLTSLRSDIHLRSLCYLSLYKCSRLKEFSVTSENMITLNLVETAINELPSSICYMSKLESLNLSGCERLKNLPSNLFDILLSLRWLWLDDWCKIFELVDNINMLSSLDRLTINGIALGSLRATVKDLSSLKFLLFNRCRRRQCLPELPPSIRALSAADCSSLETVTSVAIECTTFENCVKLDEYSVKAILAYVMLHINKSLSGLENYNLECNPASIMCLESRVPDWFKYRTKHAGSITIDLSSAPLYMDWGLLLCFVFSPSQTKGISRILCTGYLRITNSQSVDNDDDDDNDDANDNDIHHVFYQMDATNLTSDHFFLSYTDDFCSILDQNIRESKTMENSKILYKINVLLLVLDNDKRKWQKPCQEIKEFGVCPTYVLEYQNFIKQMEVKSQASASGMGVGCSYQNKDDDFKGLTFPPYPTTARKNRTQGFKDIINL